MFLKVYLMSLNYLIWEMFKKGFFIVFEGIEGSGKSYQSKYFTKN